MASKLLPQVDAPFNSDYDFLSRACVTKNEATGKLEPWPTGERYEYLRYMAETRLQHKIYVVEKSRRMMATWLFVCLYLYDVLTQRNHANFVVSKKLENSAYLLGSERMLGVYERIPVDVWPHKPRLEATGKNGLGYELLTCPDTGSFVQAVASGADQLRQFTASNVFFDEFAFQERQREAWTAAKPTVEGGGHIDIVSTPELGAYMYDLIYDTGRA